MRPASSSEPQRVGIFGGTFDPPHFGHLVAAQEAFEVLRLDRLLWIPALESPHRTEEGISDPEIRVRMVRGAVESNPEFSVDEMELSREPPSYTVDTLMALAEREPATTLFLVLGVDQWARFGAWHRPREIARFAQIALLTRVGERASDVDPGLSDGAPPPFSEVPMTRIDISGTLVRDRVREGRSIRYLVPQVVRRIIEEENLYLT